MRRREILFAPLLAAMSHAQISTDGLRGIRIDSAVTPTLGALADAHVQFVSLENPSPAFVNECRKLGIPVVKRPLTAMSALALRDKRGLVFGIRPVEADCLRCIANGAAFVIDLRQTDLATVKQIYSKLAQFDTWTTRAIPIVDFGLVASPACAALLLGLHEQFDLLHEASDFFAYRALLVPEAVSAVFDRKVQEFRRRGGSTYSPAMLEKLPRAAAAEILRTLVPKPAVLAPTLPAEAEVTVLEQRLQGGIRRVAHVLYYPNDRPGVLEKVQLSVRLPQHPLGVVTVPDQKPVEFVHNEFLTTFTLPRISGHQAIAFE